MRHQLSIIVLFLSPPLVSCPLYADWSMILEPFLPLSPPVPMPAPQIFPWILRCSHDFTCFVSLLFVWHDFYDPTLLSPVSLFMSLTSSARTITLSPLPHHPSP